MDALAPLNIGLVMGLILAWAVLALSISFRLFHFPDLTIEGSFPLGAAAYAVCVHEGGPPLLGALLACAAGAGAGAVTGAFYARFQLNKFLAGILVVAIAYSLTLRLMGASNIGLLREASLLDPFTRLDGLGGFELGSLVFLVGLAFAGCVVVRMGLATRAGLRLRTAGSNPGHARSLGIRAGPALVLALAGTNALAGFSGALLAMRQGFVDVGMGAGTLVLALAAMTIGERLLPQRRFSVVTFVLATAVLGSVAYQTIVAYAVRLGVAPTDLRLVTAVLVLGAVAAKRHSEPAFTQDAVT